MVTSADLFDIFSQLDREERLFVIEVLTNNFTTLSQCNSVTDFLTEKRFSNGKYVQYVVVLMLFVMDIKKMVNNVINAKIVAKHLLLQVILLPLEQENQ